MTKLLIRLNGNLCCRITMDKNKCKETLQIRSEIDRNNDLVSQSPQNLLPIPYSQIRAYRI